MDVSPLAWTLTAVFVVGLLVFDFVFHVCRAHTPSLGEAARCSAVYVGIAVLSARRRRRDQHGPVAVGDPGVLLVTVVASPVSPEGRAQNAVSGARRHATQDLDASFDADAALRSTAYDRLLAEEETIRELPEKYRARIREEEKLTRLLA